MTHAETLAEALVRASGGHVRAVVLYGSHLLKTRTDKHSALDFVVIVSDYRAFYAGLAASHELHRPVSVMTALARILAPNTMAFAPDDGADGIAKCLVVSTDDFEHALGPAPRDHFLLGRLIQKVETIWSDGPEAEAWVAEQLAGARARVLEWMLPYLETEVDALGLGRRALEVCYQGEFRPEAKNRAVSIFQAQAEHFQEVFPAVLEQGVRDGVLERLGPDGDTTEARFRPTAPATLADRLRWRNHFRRSKTRATLRWFKHIVTFSNWLPYIVRKVERHTGRTIRLTRIERALPVIFLWPRAIWVLLTRPRREVES